MEALKYSYSFILDRSPAVCDDLPVHIPLGDRVLSLSGSTPYLVEEHQGKKLLLYGYAVDVIEPESDWCSETLRLEDSAEGILARSHRLGGKYIIFLLLNGRVWCMGDATTSAVIFYDDSGRCASSMAFFPEREIDRRNQAIRMGSDLSQPMPYDITKYRNIKQLLPDHVLNVTEGAVQRVLLSEKRENLTPEAAAQTAAPRILSILKMYSEKFRIECPITSGKDSRVILAAMNSLYGSKNFSCYTMWSDSPSFDQQDVEIPKGMARRGIINHRVFPYEDLPSEMTPVIENALGEGNFSMRTAMIAWTIGKNVRGQAVLNGDIMGQVGKCSLHRGIPEKLATPGYFRCKLHNFTKGAAQEMALWREEVCASGEKTNVFDMFSIESRLGRWAAQENQMYDLMGIPYFNIFNSAEIIRIFSQVDRGRRARGELHRALLLRMDPALADEKYGQDRFYERAARSCWQMFYIATWVKYLIGCLKFKIQGKKV